MYCIRVHVHFAHVRIRIRTQPMGLPSKDLVESNLPSPAVAVESSTAPTARMYVQQENTVLCYLIPRPPNDICCRSSYDACTGYNVSIDDSKYSVYGKSTRTCTCTSIGSCDTG